MECRVPIAPACAVLVARLKNALIQGMAKLRPLPVELRF
jgi:hypothetical protein